MQKCRLYEQPLVHKANVLDTAVSHGHLQCPGVVHVVAPEKRIKYEVLLKATKLKWFLDSLMA